MENNKLKIIVAHPERQHSFQLASALKKNDMLFKYITTVYDKNSSFIMKIIKGIISKNNLKRANGRKNPDLDDTRDVIQFCELRGFINILLFRVDKSKILYNYWRKRTADKFGKKVAEYAIKNNVDAVILFDMNVEVCFKILKEKAPKIKRIMDVSAANRIYMKEIYERDLKISPEFSQLLIKEIDFLSDIKKLEYLKREVELSQYFIVGSEFVKRSLIYSSISNEDILVCPYGVNTKLFTPNNKKLLNKNDIIEFVFIGGTKQLKGISYLLEAFMKIEDKDARLTIIGDCNLPDELLARYNKKVNFAGNVLHSEVSKILAGMDVMIFPSLGEGMSLSVLEAMASGLMIITSENSGTNDLISEGVNGFVIPIQNKEVIIEKIDWCINNKSKLKKMGENARIVAEQYTWEAYERRVSNIIKKICE